MARKQGQPPICEFRLAPAFGQRVPDDAAHGLGPVTAAHLLGRAYLDRTGDVIVCWPGGKISHAGTGSGVAGNHIDRDFESAWCRAFLGNYGPMRLLAVGLTDGMCQAIMEAPAGAERIAAARRRSWPRTLASRIARARQPVRSSTADSLVPGDLAYVPPPFSTGVHPGRWAWVASDNRYLRLAADGAHLPVYTTTYLSSPTVRLARGLQTLEAAQAWLRDRAEGKVCL